MAKKSVAKPTAPTAANPDDVIRDAILRHLFEVHRTAKGPSSAAIGIRELQSSLKQSHAYKQQQVGSNLDYLVQKGWVAEVVRERSFKTPRGTMQSAEQHKYKLSHIGIDKLQRASLYQRTPLMSSVNVTNIHGVTVIGDGNVVNTHFTDLSRVLTEIKAAVQTTTKVEDEQKLSIIADIDTLQAQLQKPQPNKTVVSTLWKGIEATVTAAGFAELCRQAGSLIVPLLV